MAADVEKALTGIDYPKSKQDLVQYVSQKSSTVGFDLIQSNYFNSIDGDSCKIIIEHDMGLKYHI